jgi:histidinol-phosphate aminotransferase
MGYALNRRQWLKTSAIAVAGLLAGPGLQACRKEASALQRAGRNESPVLLNNNESPFGISPNARDAIAGSIDLSTRYPHDHYIHLIELIAERENIPPDHIILGTGSTDVMVTLIHLVKGEGEILLADPSYFDFVYYANRSDCRMNMVPVNDKYEHDLSTMEKKLSTETGLIYICNPNNPTGSISPKDGLKSFCEHASKQALVVVDEAYHEYVKDGDYESMIGLVNQGKNIIVTRTFSKIFGLAGLRIGYGMAHPDIIKKLNKLSRNFAPVAWLSLKAAIASYQDRIFVQNVRQKNEQVKSYLYGELEKLGLFYIPSHTNFVLFRVGQSAQELTEKLAQKNIFVRPFGLHDSQWIRVSCGTKEELQVLVNSLAELV